MTFQPSPKTVIEEGENEISDCKEAISVLDNAIACKFLFDRHSLECQNWIKEYQQRIEHIDNALEMARAKIARSNG